MKRVESSILVVSFFSLLATFLVLFWGVFAAESDNDEDQFAFQPPISTENALRRVSPTPAAVVVEPVVLEGVAAATAVPEPTAMTVAAVEAVAPDAVELGDAYRIGAGGFSFRPIPSYIIKENGKLVRMVAHGATGGTDLTAAPEFILAGQRFQAGDSASDTVNAYIRGSVGERYRLSEPRIIRLNEMHGYRIDFSGKEGEPAVSGRIVVLEANGQGFVLFGGATAEQWENEVGQLYEAVLNSITLFTPY